TEIWSAFRLILNFRRDTERLTKIFLVEAAYAPLLVSNAIVALDQNVIDILDLTDRYVGCIQIARLGELHTECFVEGNAFIGCYRGFENVGTWRAAARYRYLVSFNSNDDLVLRSGKRQADA